MQVLDERHEGVPVLRDLSVIEAAPDEVRGRMDRGDMERYRDITEDLLDLAEGAARSRPPGGDVLRADHDADAS